MRICSSRTRNVWISSNFDGRAEREGGRLGRLREGLMVCGIVETWSQNRRGTIVRARPGFCRVNQRSTLRIVAVQ